jgi:hypothetical protein
VDLGELAEKALVIYERVVEASFGAPPLVIGDYKIAHCILRVARAADPPCDD